MYLRLCESLRARLVRPSAEEDGQSMVEYAMILIFVSIVAIVVVTLIGTKTSSEFSNVNTGLAN